MKLSLTRVEETQCNIHIIEDLDGLARSRVPVEGPLFTNFLLADEITVRRRRRIGAALEAMQESEVLVGRQTRSCRRRSSSSPWRLRLSRRGRIRCPEPNSTGSCSTFLSIIRRPRRRRRSSPAPPRSSKPRSSRSSLLPRSCSCRSWLSASRLLDSVVQYAVNLVVQYVTERLPQKKGVWRGRMRMGMGAPAEAGQDLNRLKRLPLVVENSRCRDPSAAGAMSGKIFHRRQRLPSTPSQAPAAGTRPCAPSTTHRSCPERATPDVALASTAAVASGDGPAPAGRPRRRGRAGQHLTAPARAHADSPARRPARELPLPRSRTYDEQSGIPTWPPAGTAWSAVPSDRPAPIAGCDKVDSAGFRRGLDRRHGPSPR